MHMFISYNKQGTEKALVTSTDRDNCNKGV